MYLSSIAMQQDTPKLSSLKWHLLSHTVFVAQGCLTVLKTWPPASPGVIQPWEREPKTEATIFYNLIWESTSHYFCHIVLVTQANPGTRWVGVNTGRRDSMGATCGAGYHTSGFFWGTGRRLYQEGTHRGFLGSQQDSIAWPSGDTVVHLTLTW